MNHPFEYCTINAQPYIHLGVHFRKLNSQIVPRNQTDGYRKLSVSEAPMTRLLSFRTLTILFPQYMYMFE